MFKNIFFKAPCIWSEGILLPFKICNIIFQVSYLFFLLGLCQTMAQRALTVCVRTDCFRRCSVSVSGLSMPGPTHPVCWSGQQIARKLTLFCTYTAWMVSKVWENLYSYIEDDFFENVIFEWSLIYLPFFVLVLLAGPALPLTYIINLLYIFTWAQSVFNIQQDRVHYLPFSHFLLSST